jgi:hypothetical protein
MNVVTMRWGWRLAVCTIALGLGGVASAAADEPLRDVIDRELSAAWAKEKVVPAAPADDAEFLRRIYLDLCGDMPTYDETIAFLDDKSTDKRSALIDRLLDDPRYAQHLADQWDLLLFSRNPPGYDTDKRDGIQAWLKKQFAENVPYDEVARALLKAEGNSLDDGPPVFYMQYKGQPEDATEAITQIFLGVQLQCARCHDHPFETWKQVDFYGMAAFVSRLDVVTVGKDKQLTKYAIGEKSTGDILFTGPAKDQKPGQKGAPIRPRFLHGAELKEPVLPTSFKPVDKFPANKMPEPPPYSRKDQLAEWITADDNPYFARAIANRVWSLYFGRGVVHPVDNMSPANAPSHPALLDALTASMKANKFDLKQFTRELVNTKAYQLSSAGGDGNQFPAWFAAARVRPLSAEELAQAWRTSTGYEAVEKSGDLKNAKPGRFRPFESGYMIRFFGTPNTGTGDFQGGLQEHLYLNNGPMGNVLVRSRGSLLDALTAADAGEVPARVERLFLSLLNRRPTAAESERFAAFCNEASTKDDTAWREAAWTLMTSSEFRFNH